jgi:hypothetical protein
MIKDRKEKWNKLTNELRINSGVLLEYYNDWIDSEDHDSFAILIRDIDSILDGSGYTIYKSEMSPDLKIYINVDQSRVKGAIDISKTGIKLQYPVNLKE